MNGKDLGELFSFYNYDFSDKSSQYKQVPCRLKGVQTDSLPTPKVDDPSRRLKKRKTPKFGVNLSWQKHEYSSHLPALCERVSCRIAYTVFGYVTVNPNFTSMTKTVTHPV